MILHGIDATYEELVYVKKGENSKTLTKRLTPEKGSKESQAPTTFVNLTELEDKVDGLNRMLEANFTNLKFNVHETLDRIYVQVLDRNTEEIIREIPPEKFLDMIASMLEFVGLIVDERI